MSLLALAYQLLERPMQRRFASDRLFQAVMLLLQERVPRATALFSHTAQLSDVRSTSIGAEMPIRVFSSPDTPMPEVQLLSNGRYHVMGDQRRVAATVAGRTSPSRAGAKTPPAITGAASVTSAR
jgi:cyclic beta-1,2-glucan synthetase